MQIKLLSDKLPEAVAHLIKEVTQIKEMIEFNRNQNFAPTKRVRIGIEDALPNYRQS